MGISRAMAVQIILKEKGGNKYGQFLELGHAITSGSLLATPLHCWRILITGTGGGVATGTQAAMHAASGAVTLRATPLARHVNTTTPTSDSVSPSRSAPTPEQPSPGPTCIVEFVVGSGEPDSSILAHLRGTLRLTMHQVLACAT